jgi:hypothetical protein
MIFPLLWPSLARASHGAASEVNAAKPPLASLKVNSGQVWRDDRSVLGILIGAAIAALVAAVLPGIRQKREEVF